MKLPAKQALVFWVLGMVIYIGALGSFLGTPGSADGAGEAMGRVLAHTGFAALFSWMTVRKRASPCSWGKFAFIYLAWFLALLLITGLGR